MNRFSGMPLLALAWLVFSGNSASAAWNNVFQTCCHGCKPERSSFFAPAPTPCCPSVSYQQRCYYQPYTAYRMESKMEPVTTYQRSSYWAPVTSYRYTSYYDPCTGCCRRVCEPHTSYQLKSQCNAVTSYVQRCQLVPYTAYRQSCYTEPVVSYYNPCPTPCPSSGGISAGVIEGGGGSDGSQMPTGPKPGVREGDNLPPQNIPNGYQRLYPSTKEPPLRMDRISKLSQEGRLAGTVVLDDRITPRGGAKLTFATAERNGSQFLASTDPVGRFAIELPPGDWAMYVSGEDGKPVYHSRVNLKASDSRFVTVVSR